MRLLVSWLRDFVDLAASPQQIADTLGLRGFEVAGIEPIQAGPKGPAPQTEAALAIPKGPAPHSAGPAPQTEAALAGPKGPAPHSGGPALRDDGVIDFEVTANRPDCLSVIGFAREAATAFDAPFTPPSSDAGARVRLVPTPVGTTDLLTVSLEAPDLCPRYAAAVAEVTIKPSPAWLAARLEAAGVRPISNIVDLTNYVLMELGQPMHAFDLDRLGGRSIRIRRAQPGEVMTTLDGVERKLDPDMLVIADAYVAQAVAGVMGGGRSEVSETTTRVAIESAYFAPASVRKTSKRLGLKTEASARFERGADPNGPVVALERFIALMEQIGAGRVVAPIVDHYPEPRQPKEIHLRRDRLGRLLGATVPDADVDRILRGLGMAVTPTSDGWDVVAPTFRVDLVREADLIEEVGRHYGFDRLDATFPPLTAPAQPPDPRIARDRIVRHIATAAGLTEAVTFGFVDASAAESFVSALGTPELVRISNPLSGKFEVMRPSLVPGLLDAVAHNRRHGRTDVRLFEIGTRFSSLVGETRAFGLAWTGSGGARSEHWSAGPEPVDFFDAKGIVEQVCAALDVAPTFEPSRQSYLVDGQSATVSVNGMPIGIVGLVDPKLVERRDLPRHDKVFVAEIDLDVAWHVRGRGLEAVTPLPRFPAVVRDLSILVPDSLSAAIIRGTIQSAAAQAVAPLVGITFFDRYQGKNIPEGAVSVSVRLTFQSAERTLTDAEVQQSFDTILAALVKEHGAIQR